MVSILARATAVGWIALAVALQLAAPAQARVKGDLSCGSDDPELPCYDDGYVDVADVLILARHVGGLSTQALTAEQLVAADISPAVTGGDGLVNSADLLALVRLVLLGADVDGDGLFEVAQSLSAWYLPDTDGDGLCDGPNVVIEGVCAAGEQALGTNPVLVDSDGDGLCDGPNLGPGPQTGPFGESCVFGEDLDGNGVFAATETHPTRRDTDGDGICDAAVSSGGGCFGAEDVNRNGIREANETSAISADTDGDTICEGNARRAYDSSGQLVCANNEAQSGMNPLLANSDGDALTDLEELTQNVECPNCFAVFVMPDTQGYTWNNFAGVNGANHLLRFADYVCANSGGTPATRWREPATGKLMPIKMAVQLGDLTNGNTPEEWQRISALFDELDACSVPYLVVPGNHDGPTLPGSSQAEPPYSLANVLYNEYFGAPCTPAPPGEPDKACETPGNPYFDGPARAGWSPPDLCDDPPNCAPPGPGLPNGEWFLGNGDDIAASSRDTLPGETPGPPTAEPGRHRMAVVHAPGGEKVVFVGLELGFDVSDLDAPLDVLSSFPDSPAILLHHAAFLQNASGSGPFNAQGWGSDTLGGSIPFGQDVLNRLLDPNPQILLTLNGHTGVTATKQYTSQASGHSVWRLLRNYQGVMQEGAIGGVWGAGWNVMMAFDPDAGEVRIRSYRVADDANYRTQWLLDRGLSQTVNLLGEGIVEETRILDKDFSEPVGGWTLPYDPTP